MTIAQPILEELARVDHTQKLHSSLKDEIALSAAQNTVYNPLMHKDYSLQYQQVPLYHTPGNLMNVGYLVHAVRQERP